MKYIVWCLLALLVVLHQDYWQWDNATLVWDFLPLTLVWHGGLSLAAAGVWLLAVNYCWPIAVDRVQSGPDVDDPPQGEERS